MRKAGLFGLSKTTTCEFEVVAETGASLLPVAVDCPWAVPKQRTIKAVTLQGTTILPCFLTLFVKKEYNICCKDGPASFFVWSRLGVRLTSQNGFLEIMPSKGTRRRIVTNPAGSHKISFPARRATCISERVRIYSTLDFSVFFLRFLDPGDPSDGLCRYKRGLKWSFSRRSRDRLLLQ